MKVNKVYKSVQKGSKICKKKPLLALHIMESHIKKRQV